MDAYSLDEGHLPMHHTSLSYEGVANFIRRVYQDKTPGAWIWDANQRPINTQATQLQVIKKLLRSNVKHVKQYSKDMITSYDGHISRLMVYKRSIVEEKERAMYDDLIHELVTEKRDWSNTIKNFAYKKSGDGLINDQDVINAKAFPMRSLITFNSQNFAKCPWHNEKSASLKLYNHTNTVHCFGCGKSGDTIEVTRAQFNESFIHAVKRLTHKI